MCSPSFFLRHTGFQESEPQNKKFEKINPVCEFLQSLLRCVLEAAPLSKIHSKECA